MADMETVDTIALTLPSLLLPHPLIKETEMGDVPGEGPVHVKPEPGIEELGWSATGVYAELRRKGFDEEELAR